MQQEVHSYIFTSGYRMYAKNTKRKMPIELEHKEILSVLFSKKAQGGYECS